MFKFPPATADNDDVAGQRIIFSGRGKLAKLATQREPARGVSAGLFPPSARAAGCLFVCALVAGCLPRSNFVQPLPDRLPEQMRTTLAEPSPITATAAPPPLPSPSAETTFTLPEAIARALLANPRLLVYRAAIDRYAGLSEAAFAPFLPQVDVLNRAGASDSVIGPGAPGIVGGIVPDKIHVPYTFAQVEF